MNRARQLSRVAILSLAGAVMAAGCEHVKSDNPLAPTVAGPQAGIKIEPPGIVQPSAGRALKDSEQPLKIVISNAQSNSPRPFTMSFEIAADTQFSNILFTRTGIAPSTDGSPVQITLPNKLPAGRTYFWHLKADDGANTSGWSAPAYFQILDPIVIAKPTPLFPTENVRVTSTTPEFRVRTNGSSGPHGPLSVNFQISESPTFGSLFANAWVDMNGAGDTVYTVPPLPGPNRQLFWRTRLSDGENTGDWSVTESFQSPLATPSPGPGPTPIPGGGGPPSTCASNHGPTVVACIEAKYPQYLAAGVSHSQREANMAFLRDRIIESGRCGGLDLAWNRKRGNGPHSIDALAWRTGGGDEVVDIGLAYDDTSIPLRLGWGIVAGPPGYDGYPSFSCN
jgi:hypothetical protein